MANAVYVLVAKFQEVGAGETVVDDNGVVIDTDAHGSARGYEFLAVRERGIPLAHLPTEVATALSEFISSGALDSEAPVERDYGA
jgi:hypothetical protein